MLYVSLTLALTMLRVSLTLVLIDSREAVYSLHLYEEYRVDAAVLDLLIIVLFVLRPSFILYLWGLDAVSGVIVGVGEVPTAWNATNAL